MQDDINTRSLTKEEQDAVRRLADTTRNDPRYVRTEELDRYLCQINADERTIRLLQGAFAKLEIYRANFRVWLQHLRQKLPGFPQTPAPQRASTPPAKEQNQKIPQSARTKAQKAEKGIPSQQTPTQPVWKKFVKPKPHEAKPANAELTAEDQAQLTKLVKVLQVKNYAGKTIAAYSGAVRRLMHYARGLGKAITELSDDEFLDYAVLLQQRGSSHETLRILRSALLFHLEEVLGRPRKLPLLSGMRRAKKLPVVLSQDEVERLLQAIKNDKHRLMVSLLYSSGLRVSEVVKLRVRDVDLGDMHLAVRGGKGRKDRISVLSPAQRELLLQMMKGKAGHEFVFTSAYAPKKALSVRSLQHVFERAVLKAGIQKKATCHSLRHSFATHLLESGTDLRLIQKLLGHENVTTTTIYTHIAERSVKAVASPLKGMASI